MAVAPGATAQNFYWTVSSSSTNALSNSGSVGAGPSVFAGNLYLWLYCDGSGLGMAAAEMDVVELRGSGAPMGFEPLNGVLNAGTATELLLSVGGCPSGGLLAGVFAVGGDAFLPDIEICLVPSAANNRNITVACGGLGYNNVTIGFAKTGGAGCVGSGCFDAVTDNSWGKVKALFR